MGVSEGQYQIISRGNCLHSRLPNTDQQMSLFLTTGTRSPYSPTKLIQYNGLSLTPVIPSFASVSPPMFHFHLYLPSLSRSTIAVTFWAPGRCPSLLLHLSGLSSSSFPPYTCPQFQPASSLPVLPSLDTLFFSFSIGIYYCTFLASARHFSSHSICYFNFSFNRLKCNMYCSVTFKTR